MHDGPWKFCYECRNPRKAEEIKPVDPGSKRLACEQCRSRIYAERKRLRRPEVA